MFFVWVIIAGILQITILRDLNLLAVLAVHSGLRKGPLAGLLIGCAIGIFAGILSISPFGLNLILYSMLGFVSGIARLRIYYKENIFMEFMFSFCGVVLFYLVYFILTGTARSSILPAVLFSTAVSPILFRIVEK